MNVTENPLAQSIAEVAAEQKVPAGYAKIELSTKGKVGAPAVFHLRNFNTSEIMSLSLTEESDLPDRLLKFFEEAIYEDVDVYSFHENEIIETLMSMFLAFYSPVLKDTPFSWNDGDVEFLKNMGPDGEARAQDLISGKWKPLVDINLISDVNTYALDAKFKPSAKVIDKKSGFSVEFRLPRYGDSILLRKWLKENYSSKEKSFEKTKQLLEFRNTLYDKYLQGEDVDLNRLPVIGSEEVEAYEQLQKSKAEDLISVIRAMHLVAFDGEDVKGKTLAERIELVKDPRLDFSLGAELDKYFDNLKFGIDPMIMMTNPITGAQELRRYSFRLADLLQAMSIQGPDRYDVVFGD